MTERKNAFRAAIDALVEARYVQANREIKKQARKFHEAREPFKFF